MNGELDRLQTSAYSDTIENDFNDLTKVLIGALAGAVVGSLVGGLYTEKGTEIRERVGDRSREIGNNIKEKAADITGGIKEKVSSITDNVSQKLESTKEAAIDLFKKGKSGTNTSSINSAYDSNYADTAEISKSKVLLALLGATAAGTIVWSLTTEKGKESRQRVIRSSKNLADNIKEKIPQIKDTLQQVYNEAKEGAQDLIEKQQKDYPSTGATTSSTSNNSNPV